MRRWDNFPISGIFGGGAIACDPSPAVETIPYKEFADKQVIRIGAAHRRSLLSQHLRSSLGIRHFFCFLQELLDNAK